MSGEPPGFGDPLHDAESYAEEQQSFSPHGAPSWVAYDSPCPECGGEEFLETSRQESIIRVDGDTVEVETQPDTQETLSIICRECDTTLYEA